MWVLCGTLGAMRDLLTCLLVLLVPAGSTAAPSWGTVDGPSPGPAAAIGFYASGCLQGGVQIPEEGAGFQTIRRYRKRFYAHPDLEHYLAWLGPKVLKLGHAPLLIGDISQARGGRMRSGHRSHQLGLDMDVWFSRPRRLRKRPKDRDFASMVDAKTETTTPAFTASKVALLRTVVQNERVARVFVNWAIKRSLCQRIPKDDRAWLRKIRPWYGHDRHFHVRLVCPEGSAACENQRTLPEGDGCGVEVWFSRAEVAKRKAAARAKAKAGKAPKTGKRKPRRPPAACAALLSPSKPR